MALYQGRGRSGASDRRRVPGTLPQTYQPAMASQCGLPIHVQHQPDRDTLGHSDLKGPRRGDLQNMLQLNL
jgi:hypothetical protein